MFLNTFALNILKDQTNLKQTQTHKKSLSMFLQGQGSLAGQ